MNKGLKDFAILLLVICGAGFVFSIMAANDGVDGVWPFVYLTSAGLSLVIPTLVLAKVVGVLEEIRDRLPEPEYDDEEEDEEEYE